MDDFSHYQWLVLGLLSIIALSTMVIVFGLDRSLEAMTRRLEAALGEVHQEIENLASDMRQPEDIQNLSQRSSNATILKQPAFLGHIHSYTRCDHKP